MEGALKAPCEVVQCLQRSDGVVDDLAPQHSVDVAWNALTSVDDRNPPRRQSTGDLCHPEGSLDSQGRAPEALGLVICPAHVRRGSCLYPWLGEATGQAGFATIRLLNVPATSRAGADGRAVSGA